MRIYGVRGQGFIHSLRSLHFTQSQLVVSSVPVNLSQSNPFDYICVFVVLCRHVGRAEPHAVVLVFCTHKKENNEKRKKDERNVVLSMPMQLSAAVSFHPVPVPGVGYDITHQQYRKFI